jgi:hypothetical protein
MSATTTVTDTVLAGDRICTLPSMLKAGGSVAMESIASWCWGDLETPASNLDANAPRLLGW